MPILSLIERIPLGHPITAAEFDANMQAIEQTFALCAAVADMTAALALKLNANDVSVTNKRIPVDASYGLFTMAAGVAAIVAATETQMRDGTAGKVPDAAVIKSLLGFATVASSSGVLTLNWSSLTKLGVKVSITENISSVAISNLPDLPVAVLFESTGNFTVALPAHNATVNGLTWKWWNNDILPSLPTGNNTAFALSMRKAGTRIYASIDGLCTS